MSRVTPRRDPRIHQLLRSVRLLELTARDNAASLLAGDFETSIRGSGLVFHESRKYVPGEPVRSIDWNVTARLGEPYVKVNLEERQRDVVIALDVSPSMHTGFQERTKLEYAVEMAATLAATAIQGGDRLGYVLFADQALASDRPRGGGRQLFRFLRSMLTHTSRWERPVEESDPRSAVHELQRSRSGRYIVFLISDFLDHDIPEDLKYLRPQHDVSLLHVYDPAEFELDRSVVFGAYSPESDDTRRWISPGATGSLEQMQAFLRSEAGRYRLALSSFATDSSVPDSLSELFHLKRRLLVR